MEKWCQEEIDALVKLYENNDIPSDSLIKDKIALSRFSASFNDEFKNKPRTEKEIAGKLLGLRKSGRLPRLRR
ncbi:MAG: hypothetical protein GXY41_09875 [Phycisphaerae bacterium]|nr:hypothetical protein [Phycisphaerae bacterium]